MPAQPLPSRTPAPCRHVDVFLSAIQTVSNLGGAGFAAIKMTALGNPLLLERMSSALVEIRALFKAGDTDGACLRAPKQRRVHVQTA